MKKLYTLLFAFLLVTGLRAQTYYLLLGDTNTWAVYGDIIPVRLHQDAQSVPNFTQSGWVFTMGDTTIGSYSYKKFISRSNEWSWPLTHSYLREDTAAQQVFLLTEGDTAERIIYDFSLQTGDSINLRFSYPNGSPLHNGWYFVDSTGTTMTEAGLRRKLWLSNPQNDVNSYTNAPTAFTWTESVGCNISPLYLDEVHAFTMSHIGVSCEAYFYYDLVCAFTDSAEQFHKHCWDSLRSSNPFFLGDSCVFNLMGLIGDPPLVPELTLLPNPADEQVQLKFHLREPGEVSFSVYDAAYRLLRQEKRGEYLPGNYALDLRTADLPEGMHIVCLAYGHKTHFAKLFIMR